MADVGRFVKDQNAVLNEFASLAGVSPPTQGSELRPVIDAGIHYVDVRCDRFMDSLFWFNRVRETTSRQIQFSGAAASAALAIVEASATAIGLTPLGFTFLDQTVNNFGSGLLFNLSPSNVRTLVERRQAAYLASLSATYTSRPIALQVIQNYAAICLPPAIETEVERAIADREFEPNIITPSLPPRPDDQDPDEFAFSSRVDVPANTQITSSWIRVSGIGRDADISIQNGEYQIKEGAGDPGSWQSTNDTVPPNALVRVRVKSSTLPSAPATATLSIGATQSTFTATTAASGAAPTSVPEESPPPTEPTAIPPNAIPNPQPDTES